MPTVILLDSIKILIYYDDHMPPHFHAQYNEYEELIIIETLEIYAGELPNRQHKRVMEWARENKEFLIEKWNDFNQ